jgi:hypothetical protein
MPRAATRPWARLSEAWCSYGVWRSLVARFVRDEEVAGSNPVTPTVERLVKYIFRFWAGAIELEVQQQSTAASQCKMSPSRRSASRVAAELAFA